MKREKNCFQYAKRCFWEIPTQKTQTWVLFKNWIYCHSKQKKKLFAYLINCWIWLIWFNLYLDWSISVESIRKIGFPLFIVWFISSIIWFNGLLFSQQFYSFSICSQNEIVFFTKDKLLWKVKVFFNFITEFTHIIIEMNEIDGNTWSFFFLFQIRFFFLSFSWDENHSNKLNDVALLTENLNENYICSKFNLFIGFTRLQNRFMFYDAKLFNLSRCCIVAIAWKIMFFLSSDMMESHICRSKFVDTIVLSSNHHFTIN